MLTHSQERKQCRSAIAALLSQRRKTFSDAKSKVEEELTRTASLFTAPDKLTKEATAIMNAAYRAYYATEAAYKLFQPLLAQHSFNLGSITNTALRHQLAGKLKECKEAWSLMLAAEQQKHKVAISV